MEYKDRLVCFVDLLGFGATVEQSIKEPELAERLFDLLGEFKNGGLEKAVYSAIPYLSEDGLSTCGDYYGAELMDQVDPEYGLVATQFSDSFVISAPADNIISCQLLIKALRVLHVHFFFNVAMLMRGGIAVGPLVHERGGALFGPAMNKAYNLESNSAIYSRIVIDKGAEVAVRAAAEAADLAKAVFLGFDGFVAIDLVSFTSCTNLYSREEIRDQLDVVEQDILANASFAHPKIAYLQGRWAEAAGSWGATKGGYAHLAKR